MYKRPAAPLPILGVVDDAVRLYREAFQRAWVPALILQLTVIVVTLITHALNPNLPWDKPLWIVLDQLSPALVALYVLTMILSLVFTNAITGQLLATREGRVLSIGESIRIGVRYFLPSLLLGLLMGAIFAGGALVPADLPQVAQGILAVAYLSLAVYLAVRLLLAAVALLGGATVGAAIRSSWRITRGNWWHAAIIMVVVTLVFIAALLVLSVLASLITAVVKADTLAGMMAVQLVAAVIQAATMPFFYAGLIAAYYDLTLRADAQGNP